MFGATVSFNSSWLPLTFSEYLRRYARQFVRQSVQELFNSRCDIRAAILIILMKRG
jgi:hypothetical protein